MIRILDEPQARERVHPLSVQAYHACGEMGGLPENTELLAGIVVTTTPKSPLHNFLTARLAELLRLHLGLGWVVQEEKPVTIGGYSEPEPDVAVIRGAWEDFLNACPTSPVLVIEVAVSTLDFDRSKLAIYADGGVPECWIVLGPEKQIEVYTQPEGETYREKHDFSFGEMVTSSSLPGGFTVDWQRLFPS